MRLKYGFWDVFVLTTKYDACSGSLDERNKYRQLFHIFCSFTFCFDQKGLRFTSRSVAWHSCWSPRWLCTAAVFVLSYLRGCETQRNVSPFVRCHELHFSWCYNTMLQQYNILNVTMHHKKPHHYWELRSSSIIGSPLPISCSASTGLGNYLWPLFLIFLFKIVHFLFPTKTSGCCARWWKSELQILPHHPRNILESCQAAKPPVSSVCSQYIEIFQISIIILR